MLLQVVFCFIQYYADAGEVETWMKEKAQVVSSDDFGKDLSSAQVSVVHVMAPHFPNFYTP